MKERKLEFQENKQHARISSMHEKERLQSKMLKDNEDKKNHQLEEMRLKSLDAIEMINTNMNKRAEQIEGERKKNELLTINKIIRITENRKDNQNRKMDEFTANTTKSMDNFKDNWGMLIEQEKEKREYLKEKAFDKFAKWVNCLIFI